jgi:predicted ATPase
LAVGEIAAEIAKNLDFLETEICDVPDRHRSLRAAFDYSWARLSLEERNTFLALSVFRGGFSREAAQAVAGASLRGLSILVNKSLVMASPKTGRYQLHEMLRQYAEAELRRDPEFSKHVDEAHAAFYAALMEESFSLFTRSDQPRALGMIEQDLDNVRSACSVRRSTPSASAPTGKTSSSCGPLPVPRKPGSCRVSASRRPAKPSPGPPSRLCVILRISPHTPCPFSAWRYRFPTWARWRRWPPAQNWP